MPGGPADGEALRRFQFGDDPGKNGRFGKLRQRGAKFTALRGGGLAAKLPDVLNPQASTSPWATVMEAGSPLHGVQYFGHMNWDGGPI